MGAKALRNLYRSTHPKRKPAVCPSERMYSHSRCPCSNNYASACEGTGVRLGGGTDEIGHQHGQNNHVR